jgi:hypothetical protein
MRMADNVHLVCIAGTYMAIVLSQKPWNDGYGFLVMFSGTSAVLGLILINIGMLSWDSRNCTVAVVDGDDRTCQQLR